MQIQIVFVNPQMGWRGGGSPHREL